MDGLSADAFNCHPGARACEERKKVDKFPPSVHGARLGASLWIDKNTGHTHNTHTHKQYSIGYDLQTKIKEPPRVQISKTAQECCLQLGSCGRWRTTRKYDRCELHDCARFLARSCTELQEKRGGARDHCTSIVPSRSFPLGLIVPDK